MELKSMKIEKKPEEQSAAEIMYPKAADMPEYPYGLELRLGNEELEKLGLFTLPEVGKELTLQAKVKVTSVSSNEHLDGKPYKGVCLQITDMGLEG